MELDNEICEWVLEYIVRHVMDPDFICHALSVLSLPDSSPRLTKTSALKTIHVAINDGSVSESILFALEHIARLYRDECRPLSSSIKAAYCMVAVDSTLRFIKDRAQYLDAVKRIWRKRYTLSRAVGLISDQCTTWKVDIEAALHDNEVRKRLETIDTKVEALQAVRLYLTEEWEILGPTFLEKVADTMGGLVMKPKTKDDGSLGAGLKMMSKTKDKGQVIAEASTSCQGGLLGSPKSATATAPRSRATTACRKDKSQFRAEASTSCHGDLFGSPKSATVVVRSRATTSCRNDKGQLSAEASTSCQGDLLGSPKRATVVRSRATTACRNDKGQLGASTSCQGDLLGSPKSATTDCHNDKGQLRAEASTSCQRDLLGSPKSAIVVCRRRVNRKWSSEEEEALRLGVDRFGKGRWKMISYAYREVLRARTEVDLKDKWRNLMKAGAAA